MNNYIFITKTKRGVIDKLRHFNRITAYSRSIRHIGEYIHESVQK